LPKCRWAIAEKTGFADSPKTDGARCAAFTPSIHLLGKDTGASSEKSTFFPHLIVILLALMLVELPAVMQPTNTFVGCSKETHLHVESAGALGDGVEGRMGLEGGGGAEDETGDGELHFDLYCLILRLDTTLDWSDEK
jgi:hypothetical protein